MSSIKIVIVAFEMHPVISARSFRTTELAKELSRNGHNVTLYTVLKDYDYNNFINETGIVVKNLGRSNFNPGRNIFEKIFSKLTAYPLVKLVPLVKKAIQHEDKFDYLITIAAPHPIHWGASFVKKKNYKCWTADCGDPYMKNPFGFHPFYFKWIEKRWCKQADYITVPIEKARDGYYSEFIEKIHVIPQGFDLSNTKLSEYIQNDIPTFAYAGNCYKNGRDITPFLEYLATLNEDFKFIVYTKSETFFKPFESILKNKMELRGYIPRESLLKELSKVDFLINIKNDFETQSPSKLIDYYLTKRTILEISSKFEESVAFHECLKVNYKQCIKIPDISDYDIKNVAKAFLNLYFNKLS